MGEVYRADDLKLGQPVALKFLPPKLSDDPVRRERFFAEVRITRQLSHSNICRVYDIGEVDGRHFLSMEYIDGEDLASLMKRIGHLSNEKALDIARQLLAGLTVAHERGVLHRDLKPANIMLDGHGRVRITDFGLAIAVGDESQAEEIAGTPAYMAPEQLAGKGATVRSDIYSLGLILYEIYTGKKAFAAKTLAELREQKETQTPRAPSELREGIDPVVERVIQRCMEKDPNARPASVAQLAQALPGGDPLAAAIAAGETPSPEMVAASGSKEGLKPWIAWGLLLLIIAGTLAGVVLKNFYHGQLPIEKKPDVLVEKARQIVRNAGYGEKYQDSAHGFLHNRSLLNYLGNSEISTSQSSTLDALKILFYYRQSNYPLESPLTNTSSQQGVPLLGFNYVDLPLKYSGDAIVFLDGKGNLISFRIMPPEILSRAENTVGFNYEIFFNDAGLDSSEWEPTNQQKNPSVYADTLNSWQPSSPGRAESFSRIEAASFKGKPVSFEIYGPWNDAAKTEPIKGRTGPRTSNTVFGLFLLIITVGGIIFARQNLRRGRGDRRNATRLAVFFGCLYFIRTILFAQHNLGFVSLFEFAGYSLLFAGIIWIVYLALEPYVRRLWPHILVSWTRLLSGEWRDPLVARDVLIGFAFGSFMRVLAFFLEVTPPHQFPVWLDSLLGIRGFISALLLLPFLGVFAYVGLLSILFIFRAVLRNQIIAALVFILSGAGLLGSSDLRTFLGMLVLFSLGYLILMRFGLLAVIMQLFSTLLLTWFPVTFNTTAWHSDYGFAALCILTAIVLYAFYTSLGGRPIFGTPRLDD
jgi:serine/threonine-protein kinase